MKLILKWLLGLALFLGIWMSLLLHHTDAEGPAWYIQFLPIILIICFGVYSVTVVLYRAFTMNNCEDDYKQLMQEIKEAHADLEAKGIKFGEDLKKLKEEWSQTRNKSE